MIQYFPHGQRRTPEVVGDVDNSKQRQYVGSIGLCRLLAAVWSLLLSLVLSHDSASC